VADGRASAHGRSVSLTRPAGSRRRRGHLMRRRLGDAAAECRCRARPWVPARRRPPEPFRPWAAAEALLPSALERAFLDASLAEDVRRALAEAAHLSTSNGSSGGRQRGLRAGRLVRRRRGARRPSPGSSSPGEITRAAAVAVARELAAASVGNLGTDAELSLLGRSRPARPPLTELQTERR
jgi:hypothetical protein